MLADLWVAEEWRALRAVPVRVWAVWALLLLYTLCSRPRASYFLLWIALAFLGSVFRLTMLLPYQCIAIILLTLTFAACSLPL